MKCIVCKFDIPRNDDIQEIGSDTSCICVLCYYRVVESNLFVMPRKLRLELIDILGGITDWPFTLK